MCVCKQNTYLSDINGATEQMDKMLQSAIVSSLYIKAK